MVEIAESNWLLRANFIKKFNLLLFITCIIIRCLIRLMIIIVKRKMKVEVKQNARTTIAIGIGIGPIRM